MNTKLLRPIVLLIGLIAALLLTAAIAAAHGMIAGFASGGVALIAISAMLTPRESAAFANNFGILNNTILLHDVFSLFLNNLLPLRNLVIDVQDPRTGSRLGKPGDTITIKDWRQDFTTYSVAPTTGYNSPTTIDIHAKDNQLTLPNTPTAVSLQLTAAEFRVLASGATGGADYEAFRNKLILGMQQSMGKKIISDWFATITAATYTTETVNAAGAFTRSTEVDLDTTLFGRNVPRDGAQMILSGATYAEWVKDHMAIMNYTGENRPKGMLIDGGVMSDTTNLEVWRTNLTMPTDAGRGFVITRTGTVAAFRIPDEAIAGDADPVSLSEIVDAKTGMPLLVRLWKNAQTGIIQLDIAAIWVFQAGQTEAVERIVATATV